MTNDELRQLAMLQLEIIAPYAGVYEGRVWAALYCIQAMDGGPRPADFEEVINAATN